VIIRVFRPTIPPGKEREEEHLLQDTWIGHYEVLTVGEAGPAAMLEPLARPSRRR
jgi:hypothetical protein